MLLLPWARSVALKCRSKWLFFSFLCCCYCCCCVNAHALFYVVHSCCYVRNSIAISFSFTLLTNTINVMRSDSIWWARKWAPKTKMLFCVYGECRQKINRMRHLWYLNVFIYRLLENKNEKYMKKKDEQEKMKKKTFCSDHA